jgi:hypothetical protein
MMEERAWVDMGRDYVRRDAQCDAAPTADDLADLTEADDMPPDHHTRKKPPWPRFFLCAARGLSSWKGAAELLEVLSHQAKVLPVGV